MCWASSLIVWLFGLVSICLVFPSLFHLVACTFVQGATYDGGPKQPGGDCGLVHSFIWCFVCFFNLSFIVSFFCLWTVEILLLGQCVGPSDPG